MKAMVVKLAEFDELSPKVIDTSFSFKPFIEYLEQRVQENHTVKNKFYGMVLEKLREAYDKEPHIELENISKYTDVLELIYISLTRLIEEEDEKLWGLSLPLMPVFLYGTDSLYHLILNKSARQKIKILEKDSPEKAHANYVMIYSFLLKKFYDCTRENINEYVHPVIDEETLLPKYYKINFDKRFVNVYAKQALPELDKLKFADYLDDHKLLGELRELLPLSMFRFEGMSVISASDVTPQYAIENIKDIIINKSLHTSGDYYTKVIQSLKALIGSNDIEFGLLPMLRLNDKLVFDEESCPKSKLVETAKKYGILEQVYMSVAEHYFNNPKLLYFETITEEDENRQVFLKALKQDSVISYALVPVFHNNTLAGVLELHSKKEGVLNTNILRMLETAIPFIAQLLQDNLDGFNATIETVIKDKFTSLQPAVQWKFKESAFRFIQQSFNEKNKPETEPIVFNNVYPLYGAIDIRNSSVERNNATRDDLQLQLQSLLNIFQQLTNDHPFSLADEIIYKIKKWKASLEEAPTPAEEYRLNSFLDTEVMPFLEHTKLTTPALIPMIDDYIQSLDKIHGEVHENRRNLEDSMQLINKTINSYLDQRNAELQQSYPFYFEKFRTDGIEYDIYIGQSISPDKHFDNIYLKNLRLWQLQSMADIYKLVLALQPQMQNVLHITQLIFINTDTIDISFRTDEKKFDVEGAYNIRYQLIKKRIDKVHVKETGERLTQPGKIALIYFNNKEAKEYKDYILYLQEQQVLTNELEELELEELQGVSGLKALRVTINVD